MFVYCTACGYDSGDQDSNTALAAQVTLDGGTMAMTHDQHGNPSGWDITCPNGHTGDDIHLD